MSTWPTFMPPPEVVYSYAQQSAIDEIEFDAGNTRYLRVTDSAPTIHNFKFSLTPTQYALWRVWWRESAAHASSLIEEMPFPQGAGTDTKATGVILGPYQAKRTDYGTVDIVFQARPASRVLITFDAFNPGSAEGEIIVPLNDLYDTSLKTSSGQIIGDMLDGYSNSLYPGIVIGDSGSYWPHLRSFPRWAWKQTSPKGVPFIECNFEPRYWMMPHPEGNGARVSDQPELRWEGDTSIMIWVKPNLPTSEYYRYYEDNSNVGFASAPIVARGYQANYALKIYVTPSSLDPEKPFYLTALARGYNANNVLTSVNAKKAVVPLVFHRGDGAPGEYTTYDDTNPKLGVTFSGDLKTLTADSTTQDLWYWANPCTLDLSDAQTTSGKKYIAFLMGAGDGYDYPFHTQVGFLVGAATLDNSAVPGYHGYVYTCWGPSFGVGGGQWATSSNNTEGTQTTYGDSWGAGDEIGIAFDFDNDTVHFYLNGVDQGAVPVSVQGNRLRLIVGGHHKNGVSYVHSQQVLARSTEWGYAAPVGFTEFEPAGASTPEDRLTFDEGVWVPVAARFKAATAPDNGILQLWAYGQMVSQVTHSIERLYVHPEVNQIDIGSMSKNWDGDFEDVSAPNPEDDSAQSLGIDEISFRGSFSYLQYATEYVSDQYIIDHATSVWPTSESDCVLGGASTSDKLYNYQGDVYFYGTQISRNELPSTIGAWFALNGSYREENGAFASMWDWAHYEEYRPSTLPVYSKKDSALRHAALDGFQQALCTARSSDLKFPDDPESELVGQGEYGVMSLIGVKFDARFALAFQVRLYALPPSGQTRWLMYSGDTNFYIGIHVSDIGDLTYLKSDAIEDAVGDVHTYATSKVLASGITAGSWLRIGILDYGNGNGWFVINGVWTQVVDNTLPTRSSSFGEVYRNLYYDRVGWANVERDTLSVNYGKILSHNWPRIFWGAGLNSVPTEVSRKWDTSLTHLSWTFDGSEKVATTNTASWTSGYTNTWANSSIGKRKVSFGFKFIGSGVFAAGFDTVTSTSKSEYPGQSSGWGIHSDGKVYEAGVLLTSSYANWNSGDEVVIQLDFLRQEVSLWINGTNQGVIENLTIPVDTDLYPVAGSNANISITSVLEFSEYSEKSGATPNQPLECYVPEVPTSGTSTGLQYFKIDARRIFLYKSDEASTSHIERAHRSPDLKFELKDSTDVWVDYSKYIQWVYPGYIRTQIPGEVLPGTVLARITNELGEVSNEITLTVLDKDDSPGVIDTYRRWQFNTINPVAFQADWEVMHRQWGGIKGKDNAGVSRHCVGLNPLDGLQLEGHGDFYTGEVRAVDNLGNPWWIKERNGAAIVSKKYFAPGTFKVVAKFPARVGATYPFWLFHYEEIYPEDDRWNDPNDDLASIIVQGNGWDGYYKVRNHEIDFPEAPSTLITDSNQTWPQLHRIKFNAWRGEQPGEYQVNFFDAGVHLNDGQWHEIKCEWETDTNPRQTKLYIDGVLVRTIADNKFVPDILMKMTLGLWFPSSTVNLWAGQVAGFDRIQFLIYSFEYIPWAPAKMTGYRVETETYPYEGYGPFVNQNLSIITWGPEQIYSCLSEFVATEMWNQPRRGTKEISWGEGFAGSILDLAGGHNLLALNKLNPYNTSEISFPAERGSITMTGEDLETPLEYSPWDPSIEGYIDIWMVVRKLSATSTVDILGDSSIPQCPRIRLLGNGSVQIWANGGDANSATSIAEVTKDTSWHLLRVIIDDSNKSYIYVNGKKVHESNNLLDAPSISRWHIPQGSYRWAHFISFHRPITAFEVQQLYSWYANKYGVIISGY